MRRECPDALTCDMAETYHVLDASALPVRLQATLAAGLREDSRAMRALSGRRATTEQLLSAAMLDRLSFLAWAKTKDAKRGRNRPESVLRLMLRKDEPEERADGFSDEEAFEAARAAFFQSQKQAGD